MTYLVVSALFLNLVAAVAVLGRTVRRTEISQFRYTMWQVRDEIVDAIAREELGASRTVLDRIDRIETAIVSSDLFTPYRLAHSARILRRSGWKPPAPQSYDGMLPQHRALLVHAERRVSSARMRLMFLGSPSGWAVSAALAAAFPVFLLMRLLRRDRDKMRLIDTAADRWRETYGTPTDVARQLPGRTAAAHAYC